MSRLLRVLDTGMMHPSHWKYAAGSPHDNFPACACYVNFEIMTVPLKYPGERIEE